MGKFAITMTDYNRIHQVVHGVIKDLGNVERGCTFFAIVGSYFLNKHYRIKARPVAGGFALCIADEQCIIFGKNEGDRLGFGNDGFHMWVQTEEHIIDFMAPIYMEAFAAQQPGTVIPRKMFQKDRVDDKQSLDELNTVGDYIVFPDPALSEELIDHFLSRPANTDLLNVADSWFGKRASKQKPTIVMGSNDGITRHLTLPITVVQSSW